MEATKVYTVAYLQHLIQNQIRYNQPLDPPDGCNPKQYNKQLQLIQKQQP